VLDEPSALLRSSPRGPWLSLNAPALAPESGEGAALGGKLDRFERVAGSRLPTQARPGCNSVPASDTTPRPGLRPALLDGLRHAHRHQGIREVPARGSRADASATRGRTQSSRECRDEGLRHLQQVGGDAQAASTVGERTSRTRGEPVHDSAASVLGLNAKKLDRIRDRAGLKGRADSPAPVPSVESGATPQRSTPAPRGMPGPLGGQMTSPGELRRRPVSATARTRRAPGAWT